MTCRSNRLSPTIVLVLIFVSIVSLAPARAEPLKNTRVAGTVRDAAGKPVIGVRVSIARRSGEANALERVTVRTGKDGTFALTVNVTGDKPFIVADVWAEKSGYVRGQKQGPISLKPGDSVTADLTLTRGEPLAGRVELPVSPQERRAGIKAEERQFALVVVGPYFSRLQKSGDSVAGIGADGKPVRPAFFQVYETSKGGNFKIWVPKGAYALEVWTPDRARVLIDAVKVKSGSRDLVLRKAFLSEQELTRAFDAFWDEVDRNYSYFYLKKDVDWNALKTRYRPEALAVLGPYELAEVLSRMLAHLEDIHVWVETPEGRLSTYRNPGHSNQNVKAALAGLESQTKCGDFALVGKTKGDNFGYFLMTHQSAATQETVQQAIKAIRALGDAPGFIVDLREANGGNEALAREIAREFCSKEAIYAKSKYRSGRAHDAFGQVYDRVLPASDRPYLKPVVCLLGPRCVSSGEGFAQMLKCLPHVTTVGERTRGASGNPRPFRLPGIDVTVWFSRWVDLLPDGSPFEGQGITPSILTEFPAEAYQERDPTLDKAIEVLRIKIWEAKK